MTVPPDDSGRDQQIARLLEIIEQLTSDVRQLQDDVEELAARPPAEPETEPETEPAEPGPWVWFVPPAAAENDPDSDNDPRFTVQNFVAWYNLTFVGLDSSRARPIPACWDRHPALAMEIAALAYTWHAANIGARANPRDAQQWLHQWRPGFSDRLTRDWIHPDCHDGQHHEAAAPRANRFDLADDHAAQATRLNQPPAPDHPTAL